MSTRIVVPDGFTLHVENSASILLPTQTDAFINPIQEFNRDLSVACISVWADDFNRARQERMLEKKARQPRKKRKVDEDAAVAVEEEAASTSAEEPRPTLAKPRGAVILEALSATGLRSIRYGKEIPGIRYILANDLSPAATAAMRRNVEINGLGPHPEEPAPEGIEADVHKLGKIRVTESDAVSLMYSLRADKTVDCVDLDPYGTAAPFIDGAVQCVNDGGLLCVTCTDMAVLASNNYPEKCFANYGGVTAKAEYSHEAALRLLLHTLSSSAARYGRFVKPLLSLSIDFYIRVFVLVQTSPLQVKNLFSKTAVYYVCMGCQAFYEQPLGRVSEKVHETTGNVNLIYRTQPGPPIGGNCEHCGFTLHLAGPMWSGPLHDPDFVGKVFEHTRDNQAKFGTAPRMMGMLSLAREEIASPFYFTPSRVASYFQCESPSYDAVASALLNAGYSVTRSHAVAGSFKTNAPISVIHDVMRGYIKTHPIKIEKIKPGSPALALNAKEAKLEVDFKHHPKAKTPASNVKIVRYQHNPTPNWGPGMRPGKKRKAEADT